MGFRAWYEDKKAANEQRKGRIREWIHNNPREATILGMVGITTLGGVAKTYISYKYRVAQQKPKSIWDPSHGIHQELSRPMDDRTKRAYNALLDAGYSRHDALRTLGLI